MHFTLDFFNEANNMHPDQTAPREQSDLDPYCLEYRLPKNIRRRACHKIRRVNAFTPLALGTVLIAEYFFLVIFFRIFRIFVFQSAFNWVI